MALQVSLLLKIPSAEFHEVQLEVDPDEWKKLCNENGMVRILEGGKKLVSKEVTYYDKDVLNAITAEPQKLQKIFSNLFSKQKVKTGDVFLVWRMRQMINAGTLEVQGDWAKGWKEIVLKLAGSNTPANETVEPSTL